MTYFYSHEATSTWTPLASKTLHSAKCMTSRAIKPYGLQAGTVELICVSGDDLKTPHGTLIVSRVVRRPWQTVWVQGWH